MRFTGNGITNCYPDQVEDFISITVLTVSVAGETASSADFAPVSSFTVTIGATEASGTGTFELSPVDDALAEGSETLAVTGTTDASDLTVTAATLTLTDNDTASTSVSLELNPATVDEDADSAVVVTVAARLNDGVRSEATVVTVSVSGGTASEEDFEAVSDIELTIPATDEEGTATFTLTPVNDDLVEGNETITVTGRTDDVSDLAVTPTVVTVVGDDSDEGARQESEELPSGVLSES